jgi:predicted TIM-barrel fold metal-dependent hydrolase
VVTLSQPLQSTRRTFLGASAALALGTLAGSRSRAAEEEPRTMGWIDAHSHIWTPDVERYPLAPGRTRADLDPPSFTTQELLRTIAPHGVTRVVLIGHSQFYLWDNTYMLDAAKAHPETFRIVGMVDDRGDDPAARMRELAKRRVTGFRITPGIHGRDKWLASDGMAAMWSTAVDTRQAMCCLINPEDIPDVSAMCRRFPETPVVVDHFARVGIDGEIRDRDVKALCGLAKHEQVCLKVSAFYALGNKRPPHDELGPMIRRVHEAFGPERLMWASDAPYQLVGENTYAASIALVRDRLDFLTDADREHLLRRTAERVFGFTGS